MRTRRQDREAEEEVARSVGNGSDTAVLEHPAPIGEPIGGTSTAKAKPKASRRRMGEKQPLDLSAAEVEAPHSSQQVTEELLDSAKPKASRRRRGEKQPLDLSAAEVEEPDSSQQVTEELLDSAKPKASRRRRSEKQLLDLSAAEVEEPNSSQQVTEELLDSAKPKASRRGRSEKQLLDLSAAEVEEPNSSQQVNKEHLDSAEIEHQARGSDDEAPEEVSLSTGKQIAEKQRQIEKEMQAHTRRGKKRRKQQTSEELAEADAEEIGAAAATLEASKQTAKNGATAEETDMLPADVIAALQEQARVRQRLQLAAKLESEKPAPTAKRKKREKVSEWQAGPVTVKVLDDKPVFSPSESALEFARQRLYGARLKRSKDMLQSMRNGGTQIYRPSVTFGQEGGR